jgi:multimeric flavodoxin WrbA
MPSSLTLIVPGQAPSPRFGQTLEYALSGRPVQSFSRLEGPLTGASVLFAVPLDSSGVNHSFYDLLAFLRTHPGCLSGCAGGILVDGPGDLYTKSVARELALAANQAGCALVGRPLVEATGDLRNFTVQAKNAGCALEDAYRLAARELTDRILAFDPPRHSRPKLAVLHASSHRTSNTLALWGRVRGQLEDCCDITEIGLRNGTLEDCAGCPYTMCLHFGEKGGCFYGGVMVQEVYPAVRDANAVMLLCPNYNDALSANLTACVNRLTALYRTTPFTGKAVYAIVVSGYSGGDIVARQIIGAMSMNKGFYLPPQSCLLETANDAGSALRLPGIDDRLADFAARIRAQLCR